MNLVVHRFIDKYAASSLVSDGKIETFPPIVWLMGPIFICSIAPSSGQEDPAGNHFVIVKQP